MTKNAQKNSINEKQNDNKNVFECHLIKALQLNRNYRLLSQVQL